MNNPNRNLNYFFIILFFFGSRLVSFSEWNYQFNGQNIKEYVQQGNKVFFGRNNGITVLDLLNGEKLNFNTINSDLKGNNINSMVKLTDGKLLLSSEHGLNLVENGLITSDNLICKEYPDIDAKKLYQTKDGTIWTFSDSKVHWFNDDSWNTIDISDSIITNDGKPYPYKIDRLLIRNDEIWVLYNDLSDSNGLFDNLFPPEPNIKVAIIDYYKVLKTFQLNDFFPSYKGEVYALDLGDQVIWKNRSTMYIYNGVEWKLPLIFQKYQTRVSEKSNLVLDNKGNVWYIATLNNFTVPVCFDPKSEEITLHMIDSSITNLSKLILFKDGELAAYSKDKIFFFKNNRWESLNNNDFGLAQNDIINPMSELINGQKYLMIENSSFNELRGTLVCLNDKSKILPISPNFKYSMIKQVEINKYGKGVFEGTNNSYEQFGFENDTGFVKFEDMTLGKPSVKLAPNGNIYFDTYKLENSTSFEIEYISTWNDINIDTINCGFGDKKSVWIEDFTFKNDNLYIIGKYFYKKSLPFQYELYKDKFVEAWNDTMSNFLAVYNFKDISYKKFDITNSDFPDFYSTVFYLNNIMFFLQDDSVFYNISIDKFDNSWILTSKSLIKFDQNERSKIFNSPIQNINPYIQFEYSDFYHELITFDIRQGKLWFFDIVNERWDSTFITKINMKGKLLRIKKLLDGSFCGSDDLGYLYRYKGKGTFEEINLNLFGKINISLPINDFCQGADGKFYLGTDIGLFSSSDFTDIKYENESSDIITISPNPASESIVINLPDNQKIEIYNSFGIKVFDIDDLSINQEIIVDISAFSQGVYFVKSGNRTGKFVIIR